MLVFAAFATVGLPINTRYAFVPAAILCIFCGAALCGWLLLDRADPRRRWWLAAAALVALALLATAPSQYRTDHHELRALARQQRIQNDLVALVDDGSINDKLARQVFDGLLAGEGTPEEIVAARGLAVVSDESALGDAVDAALAAQPDVAEKVRGGKVQAAGALVGAVMKATRGQADASVVRRLVLEKLGVEG